MTMLPIPQIGEAEISGIIVGVIVGLVSGGFWIFVSWYKRRKELRAKLYDPLRHACCNLLLLFDKINIFEDEGAGGKELFNSAVKHLNDIMYNYDTAVPLKGKLKNSEEDYSIIFYRVKDIIDLNQSSISSNWPMAVRWFKNAKERTSNSDDAVFLGKIKDFEGLYKDLKNLKEFCERKYKSLKGEGI